MLDILTDVINAQNDIVLGYVSEKLISITSIKGIKQENNKQDMITQE